MDEITIEQILENIRNRLRLSKEREYEVLSEIRTHLEDAVAEARLKGQDEQAALLKAAESFGGDEVGTELQQVHSNWEAVEAIRITAMPVLFAIILRWMIFAPDGSALDWPRFFSRPEFWGMAMAALVIPILLFRRWRFALVGWGIFWFLTVIFIAFPSINQW